LLPKAPNGDAVVVVDFILLKALNGLEDAAVPKGEAVEFESLANPEDANTLLELSAVLSEDFVMPVVKGDAVEKFENAACNG